MNDLYRWAACALLSVIFLLVPKAVLAQECDFTVVLRTRADINAFACTEITGSLLVLRDTSPENPSIISSLAPLEGLTSVGGDVTIADVSITSLSGLQDLTEVGGRFGLFSNARLASLEALANLETLGDLEALDGGLTINDNTVLTGLSGLEGLTQVGGPISITQNPALVSLTGLDNLRTATGLTLNENPVLVSLDGLGSLREVRGTAFITRNPLLASLEGLASLEQVQGNLSIVYNDALTSLAGLENLLLVEESFYLNNNDALTSLLAGPGGPLFIGGSLLITDNRELTSLDELPSISSLGENLYIADNSSLASLSGLGPLTSIGGSLYIIENRSLSSLDGLEGVETVGLDVYVERNDILTDCACGLSGVVSGSPPAFTGVAGLVSILDNAPGGQCESPDVVATTPCGTVANEPTDLTTARFALDAAYPNPFSPQTEAATFVLRVTEAGPVRVTVYDLLGRETARLVDRELPQGIHEVLWNGLSDDTRKAAAGTYFVRMEAGDFRHTRSLTVIR